MIKHAININKFCAVLFGICVFLLLPAIAQAATLYFSPSSGSHAVGSVFTVRVYVSSPEQAMNAASGIISFPTDTLEVLSLFRDGTISNLWVQEPVFSNTDGVIRFEGITLNPGFVGNAGRIIAASVRARAAGTARLHFTSGSVLANDGRGTNILRNLGSANFDFGAAARPMPRAVMPPAPAIGAPAAPRISSFTHPDPNQWYATNNAKFTWDLPPDATAARLLVGRMPRAVPTAHHSPAISSRELSGLADGIWYFHAQLQNAAGWGGISSFRFKIDTERPSRFEIRKVERKDPTDPRVRFIFNATDKTSGIKHFLVQSSGGDQEIWQGAPGEVYETPVLSHGRHILIAQAVDQAGNTLASSVSFEISALEAPIILEHPATIASGERLVIRGKTEYPGAQTKIWIQREGQAAINHILQNDAAGNFTFISQEKPQEGVYTIWAETIDQRGARSDPSLKTRVMVEQPAFIKFGSQAVSILAVIVSLIALIMLFGAMIYYGWHKFIILRQKVRKETSEAEHALHRAFVLLKETIREEIKTLEKTKTKRQLTEEEEKIIKRLNQDLDAAEKYVQKEIEDIKREG